MATGYYRLLADITFCPEDEGREEYGDIESLARHIAEYGLLHPLVINTRDQLIAGRRRLKAIQSLGWTRAAVNVVDNLEDLTRALRAETGENVHRKSYTPSEAVRIGKRMKVYLKREAEARMRAGVRPSVIITEGSTGQTRDLIGKPLGMSGLLWERAEKVYDAAKRDPERLGHLIAKMDSEGVMPAFNELRGNERPQPAPPSDNLGDLFQSLNIQAFRRWWQEQGSAMFLQWVEQENQS